MSVYLPEKGHICLYKNDYGYLMRISQTSVIIDEQIMTFQDFELDVVVSVAPALRQEEDHESKGQPRLHSNNLPSLPTNFENQNFKSP